MIASQQSFLSPLHSSLRSPLPQSAVLNAVLSTKTMVKLTASIALLTLASTSAFHVPNKQSVIPKQLTTAATTAAIAVSTSPLIALAEQDDDYVYGAVSVSFTREDVRMMIQMLLGIPYCTLPVDEFSVL